MQSHTSRPSPRGGRFAAPVLVAVLLRGAVSCALEVDQDHTNLTPPTAATDTLKVTGQNWRYFFRGSDPMLFAGPGGPEDLLFHGSRALDGTRAGGDQQSIIAWLTANGGDALYVQAVKSHGGDGIVANGSYPACPKASSCYRYANPFPNGDPRYPADARILDQWFTWLSSADAAGITTHLFLYDDSACPWYGLATAGRIGDRAQCHTQGQLIPEEDARLITPLVNKFKTLRNIVWVVAEEYSEAVTASRAAAIAARIRALDPAHPIAVHQRAGTAFGFAGDPNARVFHMQLGPQVNTVGLLYRNVAKAYNLANGGYAVVLAESAWHQSLVAAGDRTNLRKANWASVMAGAAGVLVYGMWEPTIPDTSMLGDLRRLKTFFEATNLPSMSSADAYISAATDYARSDQIGGFILYSDGCTEGALLGYSNVTTGADYSLYWFDAIDGSSSTETKRLTVGANALPAPSHVAGECGVWGH
jgi:hypothetical protein